jgi:hypothetical protein
MSEFLMKRGSYLTLFFCGKPPVVFKAWCDGEVVEDNRVRYCAASAELSARIAMLRSDPRFTEAWTMDWSTNRPAQQIF